MAEKKKKTAPTPPETIIKIEPIDRPRSASRRAKKEAPPAPVDTRKTCAVCGTKSNRMFARVGDNDWVCCPSCLARYGKTRA